MHIYFVYYFYLKYHGFNFFDDYSEIYCIILHKQAIWTYIAVWIFADSLLGSLALKDNSIYCQSAPIYTLKWYMK